MKLHTSLITFFLLLSIPLFMFSQEEKPLKTQGLFEKQVKHLSEEFTSEINFVKAQEFYFKEQWDSTLVYSLKQLNENSKKIELNDLCYFFRGFSFKENEDFKAAKKELLKISKTFNFYNYVHIVLARIALEEGENEKAEQYYEYIKDVNTFELCGVKKSNIENNLGLKYLHSKEYSKAETYLLKSIASQEQEQDTLNLIAGYGNLASIYYEQMKDDKAIPYYLKAYQLSKQTNDFKAKRNASLNMSIVEENREDYKRALKYNIEYHKWADSVNSEINELEVERLENELNIQAKEKEVTVLQAENKAKVVERNGLLYTALVLLVLLGTTIYFYKEKIKTNKVITAQKEDLNELNTTKDKLFSIVSHDLRSSVNALKTSNAKLLENVEAKNLEQLDGLLQTNSSIVNGAYNLLDNLLNWALLQTKQSYFEIEPLRLYSIVEQVAYNYKPLMLDKVITFENNVLKSSRVNADQESLKIILRNLLDNAIKFSKANGFIKIYTEDTNKGYYDLVIEDSGIGIDEITIEDLLKESTLLPKKGNKKEKGTGLGLQLCKSMAKKNKGHFKIESKINEGTKMIISLPKTKQNG